MFIDPSLLPAEVKALLKATRERHGDKILARIANDIDSGMTFDQMIVENTEGIRDDLLNILDIELYSSAISLTDFHRFHESIRSSNKATKHEKDFSYYATERVQGLVKIINNNSVNRLSPKIKVVGGVLLAAVIVIVLVCIAGRGGLPSDISKQIKSLEGYKIFNVDTMPMLKNVKIKKWDYGKFPNEIASKINPKECYCIHYMADAVEGSLQRVSEVTGKTRPNPNKGKIAKGSPVYGYAIIYRKQDGTIESYMPLEHGIWSAGNAKEVGSGRHVKGNEWGPYDLWQKTCPFEWESRYID